MSIPNFAAASYPFSPVIRAPSFSVPFLFFSSSAYMRPDSFSIHASCTVVVKLIRAQILSFRPLHGIAVDRYCAEVPRIIQVSVPTSFDIGFNIEAALLSVIKGHDELVGTAVTHILGLGWYGNQVWRFMCLESNDRIGPFQAGSFQNAVSRPNVK